MIIPLFSVIAVGIAAMYFALMALLHGTKSYSFNRGVALTALAIAGKITAIVLLDASWLNVVPVVLSIVLFLLLVFLVGNQVSGETLLLISALVMLLVMSVAGIFTFALSLLLVLIWTWQRTMQQTARSVGEVGLDVAFQTGLLERVPGLRNLEVTEDSEAKKTSISYPLSIIYTVALIAHLAFYAMSL